MGTAFKLNGGLLFISTEAPGGVYNASQLKKIAQIAEQESVVIKATEDQRLGLFVPLSKVPKIASEMKSVGLGMRHYQDGLHQPVNCAGEFCPEKSQDAMAASIQLTKELSKAGALNSRLKIGINGCGTCCVPIHTLDISLVGEAKGYRIYLGGKNSLLPEMASFMAEGVPAEKVVGFVVQIVEHFKKFAQKGESLQDVMERCGSSDFIKILAPYSQDAHPSNEGEAASEETDPLSLTDPQLDHVEETAYTEPELGDFDHHASNHPGPAVELGDASHEDEGLDPSLDAMNGDSLGDEPDVEETLPDETVGELAHDEAFGGDSEHNLAGESLPEEHLPDEQSSGQPAAEESLLDDPLPEETLLEGALTEESLDEETLLAEDEDLSPALQDVSPEETLETLSEENLTEDPPQEEISMEPVEESDTEETLLAETPLEGDFDNTSISDGGEMPALNAANTVASHEPLDSGDLGGEELNDLDSLPVMQSENSDLSDKSAGGGISNQMVSHGVEQDSLGTSPEEEGDLGVMGEEEDLTDSEPLLAAESLDAATDESILDGEIAAAEADLRIEGEPEIASSPEMSEDDDSQGTPALEGEAIDDTLALDLADDSHAGLGGYDLATEESETALTGVPPVDPGQSLQSEAVSQKSDEELPGGLTSDVEEISGAQADEFEQKLVASIEEQEGLPELEDSNLRERQAVMHLVEASHLDSPENGLDATLSVPKDFSHLDVDHDGGSPGETLPSDSTNATIESSSRAPAAEQSSADQRIPAERISRPQGLGVRAPGLGGKDPSLELEGLDLEDAGKVVLTFNTGAKFLVDYRSLKVGKIQKLRFRGKLLSVSRDVNGVTVEVDGMSMTVPETEVA